MAMGGSTGSSQPGAAGSKSEWNLEALAISAMWFAGFNTFQPLNICRGGSSFLMQRFGYSLQKTGVFVGETNASVNYFVFWGTLSAMLLSNVGPMIATDWSKKYITPLLSIISSVVIVIINLHIFRVYRSFCGCIGVRKIYYWMSLAGLAYSFDMTVTRNITPDKSVDWSFGENCANGFVSLLHWLVRTGLKCLRIPSEEHHYYIMFWHIMFVVGLSIFTLLLWLLHLYKNVFTIGASKSELADALTWLLKLNNSNNNGSRPKRSVENGQASWDKYLGGGGTQGTNFEAFFGKLKELNNTLKDMQFTNEVTEGEKFSGTLNITSSKYQLRSYVEKVMNKTEGLKRIADKISTCDLSVCVTLNGETGKNGNCCCTGKLSVYNQYALTITGLRGTLKTCVTNCLCGTSVKLCACLETTMVLQYCDKTTSTNAIVKVASGFLCLSSSGDAFTITGLTCTTADGVICSGKLKSVSIFGLEGSMDGCGVTSLTVGMVLEFGGAGVEINEVCKTTEGAVDTSASITLQSTSCIMISGIVKTSSTRTGSVAAVQTCEAFSFSSYASEKSGNIFYYEFSLAYGKHSEKTAEASVEVVACSMGIATTTLPNCKLEINKTLAVVITECSTQTSNNSITIQKICPVDCDQRNHYEDFRDELKDLFPTKRSQINAKLSAGGVCESISGVCCCSGTKTIIINCDKANNVCLYKIHQIKEKLRGVSGKQSKFSCVQSFIDSKTSEVEKGYNASLRRGASPASMTITGTIILFFIYPSVSPYLMVAERHTYFTSLILLFISSVGPFIPWVLGHKDLKKHTYFKQYWTGKKPGAYHWLWVLFPIAMIIFSMFLIILHHPNGWLTKLIRYRWPAIIFCSSYHFCLYILRPIGSGGTYSNAAGVMVEDKLENPKEVFSYEADYENGKAAMTMVVSLRYSIMVISILIGQSYASSYRSYTTGDQSDLPWPTANMNRMASCYWWSRLALKKANHRFWHIRDTDIAALVT